MLIHLHFCICILIEYAHLLHLPVTACSVEPISLLPPCGLQGLSLVARLCSKPYWLKSHLLLINGFSVRLLIVKKI